jgi:hypothetical protein
MHPLRPLQDALKFNIPLLYILTDAFHSKQQLLFFFFSRTPFRFFFFFVYVLLSGLVLCMFVLRS